LDGTRVRWLRAGTRDGLARNEIALDVVDKGTEAAYLLRVRPRFRLELARTMRGPNLGPRIFSRCDAAERAADVPERPRPDLAVVVDLAVQVVREVQVVSTRRSQCGTVDVYETESQSPTHAGSGVGATMFETSAAQ
jgi:hypothetical protein